MVRLDHEMDWADYISFFVAAHPSHAWGAQWLTQITVISKCSICSPTPEDFEKMS